MTQTNFPTGNSTSMLLQVVLARAEHAEGAAVLRRAAPAPRSGACRRGTRPVTDRRLRITCAAVPSATTSPPCSPAPGPMSTSQSAVAHHLLVVLDDEHGVAEVAQPLERPDQPPVVALVEPDRRLVEDVEHADELRADLRREPEALRLAARERPRRAVEVQVADADVVEERQPLADLLQDASPDQLLGRRQLELVEEAERGRHRLLREGVDRRARRPSPRAPRA